MAADAPEPDEGTGARSRGSRFLKTVFWVGLAAGIGAAFAFAVNQRQRFAAMSDDEIGAFLAEKLGEKVPQEQLTQIQDTVISKIRGYPTAPQTAAVTGTVTYRERIAMPEDAVVIVSLEDTSLMDVPAEQIGVQVIESPGNVPVSFSVGFVPAAIVDNHSYSVRATITSGDRLLWTTDTNYPVITRGNPLTADLLLVAVPEPVDQ